MKMMMYGYQRLKKKLLNLSLNIRINSLLNTMEIDISLVFIISMKYKIFVNNYHLVKYTQTLVKYLKILTLIKYT